MKQFSLIAEADARVLEPGSTVELLPGGHITPLALDTLRARRVKVTSGRAGEEGQDLVPVAPITTVALGSDHTGVALKKQLAAFLRGKGITVHELGADGSETVDYPDVAAVVALEVSRREADAGIVIDGAGIGSAIAANKLRGIRAAMCTDETLARYSREHNGANVLTLGATLVTADQAKAILEVWLSTPMREPRYIRRLAKIRVLEGRG